MTRWIIIHNNGNYLRRTSAGHYVWTDTIDKSWLCLSEFLAKEIAKNFKNTKVMQVNFVPSELIPMD